MWEWFKLHHRRAMLLQVSILVEDRAPLEPMWQVAMARVTETEKEIVAVSL